MSHRPTTQPAAQTADPVRRIMVGLIPILIAGAIIFSTYHVARVMAAYDGILAWLLGGLLGAINTVAAYFAMEERRPAPRTVAALLMTGAAGASVWLQIRYYQMAGAGPDALILGTWGPAAEIALGLLYATLTARPAQTEPRPEPSTERTASHPATGPTEQPDRTRPPTRPTRPATPGRPPRPPEPDGQPDSKEEAIERLIAFVAVNPDASQKKIGDQIGRGKSTVAGYLVELEEAGRIHRNGNGIEVL